MIIEFGFAAEQVGGGIAQAVADQARLGLGGCQLATEVIVQVDHPALQVRPGEQLGLGGAVGFHRTVVVQVIARQVGEHRHIEVQRRDAALIQTVRGNLHGHGARAGLLEVGQGRLHGDRIGRGVAAALQGIVEAGAEGTDDAAALAQQVEGLRHQLADAGLAIGAGDADQAHTAARLAVKTSGNGRQLARQSLDRHQFGALGADHIGAFGLVSHGGGATGDGIDNVGTAVLGQARYGEEQVARAHLAAVQGQFTDQGRAACLRQQLIEGHGHQIRPPGVAAAAAVCGCAAAGSTGGGRLSGVMFIRRSEPAMTLLNTGAETRPPK